MRIIPLAEWKANAELRIKLGEFLQADELVLAACSRPHVQRDPQLMMGDASHHDALALFLERHKMDRFSTAINSETVKGANRCRLTNL